MKDGGPAFPRHGNVTDLGYTYGPEAFGMTLRDYFAAKAMHAFYAGPAVTKIDALAEKSRVDSATYIASAAYGVADSMLLAREK